MKTIEQEHQEQAEAEDMDSPTRKIESDTRKTGKCLCNLQDHLVEEEAQAILNQMPMDMGSIKDKLEEELHAYGNIIRYDLRANEDLQDVTQLSKRSTALKVELKNQANEHKAEINSFIGPSHGHQLLPMQAQHDERMHL